MASARANVAMVGGVCQVLRTPTRGWTQVFPFASSSILSFWLGAWLWQYPGLGFLLFWVDFRLAWIWAFSLLGFRMTFAPER